jgi:hypothetical protein
VAVTLEVLTSTLAELETMPNIKTPERKRA